MTWERLTSLLKQLALISAIVLLCLLSVLLFQLNRMVRRLDGHVRTLSSSVESMKTDVVRKVERFDDVVESLFDLTPAANLIAGSVAQAPGSAEAEIGYLLERIGAPGLRYEYGPDKRDSSWVSAKLALKYQLRRGTVSSAEEFIEEIAARTHEGHVYYVVDDSGRKEMSSWLHQILSEHRKDLNAAAADESPNE